ncbi:hypothetical protein DPMN_115815 [Dreissena polymorpha]|uniref:Uncharacterized protein n=1 Tax=Dreissena polymorpha TaxID=45954 RepID=A0A9D4KLY6_DREPO|nr:hypothetical protein DPMN_115815 [Dreissena polymorpha]
MASRRLIAVDYQGSSKPGCTSMHCSQDSKTNLATDAVRGCYYDSRSPREDYQQAPQKVARSTAKLHKNWTQREDQQAATPIIFTGRRVQNRKDKSCADSEGFSG